MTLAGCGRCARVAVPKCCAGLALSGTHHPEEAPLSPLPPSPSHGHIRARYIDDIPRSHAEVPVCPYSPRQVNNAFSNQLIADTKRRYSHNAPPATRESEPASLTMNATIISYLHLPPFLFQVVIKGCMPRYWDGKEYQLSAQSTHFEVKIRGKKVCYLYLLYLPSQGHTHNFFFFFKGGDA